MIKLRRLKLWMVFAIAGWFLYLIYLHHSHTNIRDVLDNDIPSAIASTLNDFVGVSPQYHQRSIVDETTIYIGKATERNIPDIPPKYYNHPSNRGFSRIPAYLQGSSKSSIFGYVMRDLSNRFLPSSSDQQKKQQFSRQYSSPSNILVVCPGANELLSEIKKENITTIASKQELIKKFGYRLGEAFLVESVFHGHNAIGIDSNGGIMDENVSNITDILLAVVDPFQGQEDDVISSPLGEYIRSGIIQFATFRISSNTPVLDAQTVNNHKTEMQGIMTAKLFLDAGYKLQVLSSSHAPTDGLNPYSPNTLLKDIEDVRGFLRFGGILAENLDDKHSSKNVFKSTMTSEKTEIPIAFHSILFATRGLDLAIPTRKAFLNMSSYKLDHVLNIKKNGVPFMKCPKTSSGTSLSFHPNRDGSDEIDIYCFEKKMSENNSEVVQPNYTIIAEVWRSHPNISLAEAACLKCTKITKDNNVTVQHKCTKRIVSEEKVPRSVAYQQRDDEEGPNILMVELKGVNKNLLKSSLRYFRSMMNRTNVQYFPNFISTSITQNHEKDRCWDSWDNMVVQDNIYELYRGSNICDPKVHSNEERNTIHHGSQLSGIFCFDYDRPNCLAGKHAAIHLFDHVRNFINVNMAKNKRWVSYITLVDGAEETETLLQALDRPLADFLFKVKADMSFEQWSNTILAIFSDDVENPILFLKANESEMIRLEEQEAIYTSDLHRAVRSIITNTDVSKEFCTSLSPEDIGVKSPLGNIEDRAEHKYDDERASPPSVLSFYADIPKENKYELIKTSTEHPNKRARVTKGCRCATNLVPWFQCDDHPWINSIYRSNKETHILVDCPGEPLHLEVDIGIDHSLTERATKKRKVSALADVDNVNIMFLEIDSVSQEYADRHFPKTRELLDQYRIKRKGENEYECIHGVCSAKFPYTQLVGANSIPNQVAALSGCVSKSLEDLCGYDKVQFGDLCEDADMLQYGLRFERERLAAGMSYWCPNRDVKITKTPWLFGISESNGYINFFAEEFCYDESPYVTQGNVFSKTHQHIQSHHVFCNLADRKIAMKNITVNKKNRWGIEMNDPCLEGYACSKNAERSTISLQYMQQMWETYSAFPKFAFLNAIAAHDYSADWEMIIPRAEIYDERLHDFLEAMLSRVDRQSTVIVIRSDHGLQKGPMAMDNSVQVEHRHPWTEILVPQNLVVSQSALFNNQDRMLTGYDLYRTIRFLMSDRTNDRQEEEGIPDWAFDILSEEIPPTRTCEDAKVDMKLCRYKKQARQYGVCNTLDKKQASFC